MREFYGPKQGGASPLQAPSSGQLLAVRAEEEEEILRAQVCEVMVDKVKVRCPLQWPVSGFRTNMEKFLSAV